MREKQIYKISRQKRAYKKYKFSLVVEKYPIYGKKANNPKQFKFYCQKSQIL